MIVYGQYVMTYYGGGSNLVEKGNML